MTICVLKNGYTLTVDCHFRTNVHFFIKHAAMLPNLVIVGLLALAQSYGELRAGGKKKVSGGGASLWSQCLNQW